MGALADSLFSVLMSWVRALVSGIWALFDTERMTLLEFLGKNWIVLAIALIAAGLVIDWLVWLVRWQPYHIWAMRVRRLFGMDAPQEEDEEGFEDGFDEDFVDLPARDASLYMPPKRIEEEPWLPLETPDMDEEQERQVFEAAEQAPDEHVYPGMRYDDARASANAEETGGEMGGTRRYAAVHAEGPGAAEVERRRAEIDAWQLQMQEEARQKAQAERAAQLEAAERERRAAQEAYEAEQARLAKEAYEAEQARLAQEAYEAEQARLAQEEYERQLAEYERQREQYERELAEYERQKAEYEAALAQQAAREAEMEAAKEAERFAAQQAAMDAADTEIEAAQEIAPGASRRRRRGAAYSEYVEGEDVTELPAAPQWSTMQQMEPEAQEAEPKADKKSLWRSGMAMMAQMMEAEENEVTGIAALPPRVDMHKAYKPAKKPGK